MNQTICARRIAALEASLGLPLFHRPGSGYALSDASRALLPLAEALEAAAIDFEIGTGALNRRLSHALRLTTDEGFEKRLIGPALATAPQWLPELD